MLNITCERSESAREQRIALCKSDQQYLQTFFGAFIVNVRWHPSIGSHGLR